MSKKYSVNIAVVLALSFLMPLIAFAQPNKLGGWYIINAVINPNNKVSYYFETQTRSQNVAKDFYYYEIKGGVAYNFQKKLTAMLAMGDYRTFTYPGNYKQPVAAKEFRIWEQLVLNNNVDRVKIEHRYRIEQRWLNGNYRNRFRYRINPIVPLNHKTIVPKTAYLTAFDEIFFTNRAPYFERNRFFAGAGYQVNKLLAIQAGYIRQFDYNKVNDGVGKNFIQTSFVFFLDKNTISPERKPNTLD